MEGGGEPGAIRTDEDPHSASSSSAQAQDPPNPTENRIPEENPGTAIVGDQQISVLPQQKERQLSVGDWVAVPDSRYDAYYFFNKQTGFSSWTPPEEMRQAGWVLPAEELEQRRESKERRRVKLIEKFASLFRQTIQLYTKWGVELMRIGSSGSRYQRKLRILGRWLLMSSRTIPQSIHVSRIEEVRCGRQSEEFDRYCAKLKDPEKWPPESVCAVLHIDQRNISLQFFNMEDRDEFVFLVRALLRQETRLAQLGFS